MCWLLDVRSSYRTPEFSADCTLQAGGGAAGLDFSEAARRLRHGAVWLLRREWDGIKWKTDIKIKTLNQEQLTSSDTKR